MSSQHRTAVTALACAGALWGLTVPLSKLSLGWLGPGWLTVARFALAAPVLAFAGRRGLRGALALPVAGLGALGFGAVVLLQNAGIERTSVSDAAVLVGAVPVIVAVISAGIGEAVGGPVSWAGYVVALGGVVLVAGGGGGGGVPGDLLVLSSAILSAAFVVLQPRVLRGRDATAVTAVQFATAAVVALPCALLGTGLPAAPSGAAPVLAVIALAAAGTMLPFWLFAYGQSRVPVQVAGAYLNLEPVVGAGVGWLAFGDVAALGQVAGVVAVLAGIVLSTVAPPGRRVHTGAPGARPVDGSASLARTSVIAPSAAATPGSLRALSAKLMRSPTAPRRPR